ncbi:hypothetical protein MBT84_45880 [Streptomyces sp. MBT84]|nr:hypothetical protein [Streptomyces sp. MBT84]
MTSVLMTGPMRGMRLGAGPWHVYWPRTPPNYIPR